MASVIIDGYNLIGINHKDLDAQRNRLIESLITYSQRMGHRIILVFDGWKSGGIREEHIEKGGIKIIYSRLGEKADAVIERIISTERQEWIVITSDRDIVSNAWRYGSIPIPSEVFYDRLFEIQDDVNNTNYNTFEDGLCLSFSPKRKPHKLSKKEKAIRRALSKL